MGVLVRYKCNTSCLCSALWRAWSSAGWFGQVSHAGCCPALPAIGRRHKLSKEGKKASGNLDGLPSPSAPVGAWPATAAVSCGCPPDARSAA